MTHATVPAGAGRRARRPWRLARPARLVATLVAVTLLAGLTTTLPAAADHASGVVHDQAAFRGSIGSHAFEAFDGFPSGTVLTGQVPGVTFSSAEGNEPLIAFSTLGAPSAPNVLFGGTPPPATPGGAQELVLTFDPPVSAVGFQVASQEPGSTPATVRFLAGGSGLSIPITNTSGSEDTPTYVGYRSPGAPITGVQVVSGLDAGGVFEEIGLDDLAFAAAPAGPTSMLAASRIAYSSNDDIWVTDEAGTTHTNLTGPQGLNGTDPHLSPDGTKIAFTRVVPGGFGVTADVWVMDIDGGNAFNLTADSAEYDADPAWSPDGTQIAFASQRRPVFDIYVVPATGGTATRLTNASTGFLNGFPSWSPDGGTIAFRSDRTGDVDIWTTTTDGSFTEVNLTNDPAEDQEPAFSPDGSSVAFTSDRGGSRDVWIMDANGADPRLLLSLPDTDEGFPAWAPDGEQLVFDSGNGFDRGLNVLTTGTGVVRQIPGAGAGARSASWSSSVSLTSDRVVTPPGASTIDPSAIPATAIPPASTADVADTPLRSVDIAASPLRSVPLRSVPLRSVPLSSVPLRSVTLSEIPLRSVGTSWEAILVGTSLAGVPLQNVTLDQLLALSPQPQGLAAITLADVDLGSTPLRSVSMVSLAMGATPLRSVPVPGPSTDVFANWCTILTSLGYSCSDLGLTPDSPILAVDLAGVPLRSVPLRSVPLRSVPLRSVDVAALPLRSVPLRSVRLDQIQLGGLPLASISAAAAPSLLTCGTACQQQTLGEAQRSQQIAPSATLGALFDAVDTAAFPVEWNLADLLQGLVDVEDYPWESLPVEEIGVHDFAPDSAPILTYDASFTVTGTGAAVPTSASVTLPPGFRYVPGSANDGESAMADPEIDGTTLGWSFGSLADGDGWTWSFQVRPSLRLQEGALPELRVLVGGAPSSALEPVTVVQEHEGEGSNDTPDGAVEMASNTIVMSHIATPGDVDYFRLPVPPKGSRLQVRLGNGADDADLDVALLNGAPSTPLRSVPLRSVPLRSVPIPDHGLAVSAADEFLSSETLDDVPGTDLESTPLRSVSQNRSGADELIDTTSELDASQPDYLIQVSGFNGASSDAPYVLYVKQYAPPAAPVCAGPRTFPFAGQAGAAPVVRAGVETLILTSRQRLGATHGVEPAGVAMDKLASLAAAPGVNGLVYPIEGNAAASSALAAWDADPCSPEKANDVVGAVSDLVDAVRAASPGLKHVVLAGGDDIVPMARVADYTQLSNESDYTADLLTGAGTGNPLAAAVATQNILSDDPYGDLNPTPWLDHHLYLPELAVGRLVETPADIAGQVDLYLASGGILDPGTALTAGYDFLTDGSEAVDAGLARRIPEGARSKLVNETWTRSDLSQALLPTSGPAPDIASTNAHYDHNRALPALGNSTADESDLFTTADVTARPEALIERILFTMGCHAGLSVPDSYFEQGDASSDDWSETYLGTGQRAAVYFANTGFGYGDTAAVALSEQLMALFAERLDGSMTVGEAAVYAKQSYFGSLGAYGPYDEKAMQEATFYGLPMYRIGATPVAPPTLPTVTPAPADGVNVVDVQLDVPAASFQQETSPGGGTFYSVGGGSFTVDGGSRAPSTGEVQVTQYRPIVPRTSQLVTSADPSLVAKGFLVSDLASTDRPANPAVARPVVDLTAIEPPPPVGDVAFPTSFSNISTSRGPTGEEQRLVLLPGQVFKDVEGAGAVQRLFTNITGQVTYGTPGGDETAPFLTEVVATVSGGTLQLELLASDDSPITKVVALVHDESGTWRSLTLGDPDGDGRYTGSTSVVGTEVEYFVQALDAAGNVGITTNKGRYYQGILDVEEPEVVPASLAPTPGQATEGQNGWFTGPVTVVVDGRDGVTYDVSIDGGPATVITGDGVVTVSGDDGTHVVVARGSDGSESSLTVKIDRADPTVAITGVTNGAQLTALPVLSCASTDATSGVASCEIVVTGGNAAHTAGRLTATATATDLAGNTATTSVTYDVGSLFSGFLQPINGSGHTIDATTSIFSAGSTVPVKFQLRDAAGQLVPAPVTPVWLEPVRAGRLTGKPNETSSSTAGTTGSAFTYDSVTKTYQFNWKTTKALAGYYYRITVRLENGRTYWTYVGLR